LSILLRKRLTVVARGLRDRRHRNCRG
jgi:hypothetical protein